MLGWNKSKDFQKGGRKVKDKGVVAKKGGKVLEVELKLDGGSKKGDWTRLAKRDSKEGDHGMQVAEAGSKRKSNGVESHDGEKEKKPKVDEEARNLGILFAKHLGVAEVAKQPCQAQ